MFKVVHERIKQKYRTSEYPVKDPVFSPLYRGCPSIDSLLCAGKKCIRPCVSMCPTDALSFSPEQGLKLDMGLCIFCGRCTQACPPKAIAFSKDWRMSASTREGLYITPQPGGWPDVYRHNKVEPLPNELRKIYGRSLRLRQVSAAGCNACEADINVLGTLVFDMARFGIDLVASPRHADAVIITGPLSRNMRTGAVKAVEALPDPALIIASGACAISGGLFNDTYNASGQSANGVEGIFKPHLFIPGCPPHPYTILDGLLQLMGRIV